MAMIEVDPKLFITCRLCLEDTGVYRIIPAVQDQIKFCFDINVDLFDELPQLLCKKCEVILKEYYHTKKNIIEKQQSLIKRFQEKHTQPICAAESSAEPTNIKKVENKIVLKAKKRKAYTNDSASSDSERKKKKIFHSSWKSKYKKQFACRLCHKLSKNRNKLIKHLKCHQKIFASYKSFFSKNCFVVLNKIDEACNCTNLDNTVVFDNKIVQDAGKSTYHIVYSLKSSLCNNKIEEQQNDNTDVTPCINEKNKIKQYKRLRKLSQSSNETVVVKKDKIEPYFPQSDELSYSDDGHDIKPKTELGTSPIEPDCINIDDSSTDSLMEVKNTQGKINNLSDHTNIHNIILTCQKKASNKKPSDIVLKHKLLNIGRKVVNKGGFSCTGLIRYLEYNNLKIDWVQFTETNGIISYVRINTKLKDRNSENLDSGWKSLKMYKSTLNKNETNEIVLTSNKKGNNSTKNILRIPKNKIKEPKKETQKCSESITSKLLNETPVVNPKMLTKKSNNENKSEIVTINDINEQSNQSIIYSECPEDVMCMPIITNTTSLAILDIQDVNLEKKDVSDSTNNVGKQFPRIKVKPDSELMSDRVLNNLSTNLTPQPHNIVSNEASPLILNSTISYSEKVKPVTCDDSNNRITLTMHSAQLPNVTTASPYQYIKDLLQLNNIILIDCNQILSENFKLLFRFKMQFSQKKFTPFSLNLSWFYLKNCFCCKVVDANNKNIDIKEMLPFWQWRVFEVCNGDVGKKLMTNAAKLGPEVLDYVNKILSLLLSIKLS